LLPEESFTNGICVNDVLKSIFPLNAFAAASAGLLAIAACFANGAIVVTACDSWSEAMQSE
jgi:hypothetical protein